MQRRLVKCRKRVVTQLAQNADEKLPEEWDTAVGCLVNVTKLLEQQLEALEKQQVKRKKNDIKKWTNKKHFDFFYFLALKAAAHLGTALFRLAANAAKP